jgi:hypothetical protein
LPFSLRGNAIEIRIPGIGLFADSSRTASKWQRMASKRIALDGKRKLREGEVAIDCAKASALLERSTFSTNDMVISRSAVRRILGKEGGGPYGIVTDRIADEFAKKCGGLREDIEWCNEPGVNAAPPAIAAYLELWRDIHSISLGPYVALTMRR